jgi:hypothetical protein
VVCVSLQLAVASTNGSNAAAFALLSALAPFDAMLQRWHTYLFVTFVLLVCITVLSV